MALEKTWRWFGKKDTVLLADLKQMGIKGVVTSLHHLPAGEIWPVEEIKAVRKKIECYGMHWSVVESLPVAEGIKIGSPDRDRLIENYQISLRNLGACGVDTVCYNFMPVLDWVRTDLHFKNRDGGESMLFDYPTLAAFDIYILEREGADESYPPAIRQKAGQIIATLTREQQEELAYNIIIVTQAFVHGVVGEGKNYKKQFLDYLKTYADIGKEQLRMNLSYFLNEVVPVAENAGVKLCIHPDDPPFPLLGLPRIAGTAEDFQWIWEQNKSLTNGMTFCTGSLSGRQDNDLVKMAEEFASRIHFIHLRNTTFLPNNSFYESGHLKGGVDMYKIVKILLEEQIRRKKVGREDIRMPFRPDHGIKILDDYTRIANPGYPLIGRLKGLAEMEGLQMGIERFLNE
ncbi:mannonate dehydratase [Parabacteroides pacaensis]|uniref:mannonate dehydratase n=1 Tax=Parabacteroides pacaensis TaxID=2086575 RepID=UPI0018FE22F9|nr:mannonate dehydratase [Parabacteroides pacaensis]